MRFCKTKRCEKLTFSTDANSVVKISIMSWCLAFKLMKRFFFKAGWLCFWSPSISFLENGMVASQNIGRLLCTPTKDVYFESFITLRLCHCVIRFWKICVFFSIDHCSLTLTKLFFIHSILTSHSVPSQPVVFSKHLSSFYLKFLSFSAMNLHYRNGRGSILLLDRVTLFFLSLSETAWSPTKRLWYEFSDLLFASSPIFFYKRLWRAETYFSGTDINRSLRHFSYDVFFRTTIWSSFAVGC